MKKIVFSRVEGKIVALFYNSEDNVEEVLKDGGKDIGEVLICSLPFEEQGDADYLLLGLIFFHYDDKDSIGQRVERLLAQVFEAGMKSVGGGANRAAIPPEEVTQPVLSAPQSVPPGSQERLETRFTGSSRQEWLSWRFNGRIRR